MNKKIIFIFVILLFIWTKTIYTEEILDKRPVYNSDTVSPFNLYHKNNEETINVLNGSLKFSVTDLHISGRGGAGFNFIPYLFQ